MGYSLKWAADRPRPGSQWLRTLQRLFLDEARSAPEWASMTLASPPNAGTEGACVLVVDDNPVNLMLASEMLLTFGLRPMVAADGAEAVALANEVRLDLILMDLQMPVLDGIAATRQIRRLERELHRARVPVVAYTSTAPALRMLHDAGIDDLLDKPCDRAELQICMERWCPQLLVAVADEEASALAHHRAHAVRQIAAGSRSSESARYQGHGA